MVQGASESKKGKSIRLRLVLAFAGIIGCFALAVAVQLWADRVRARHYAELEQAVRRDLAITAVNSRIQDLQKQVALLESIYEQTPGKEIGIEEQARFRQQLEAVRHEIDQVRRLSGGVESPPHRSFREAWDRLAASWSLVYRLLGNDTEGALLELSIRSAPLSDGVFRNLPRWQQYENAEMRRAHKQMEAAGFLTRSITAAIFAASALLTLLIAWRIFRFVIAVSDQLELRVAERTAELEQEVTERRKTEQELLESRERYAHAARGANDGLWDWDLREQRIHFSPRWKAMLGYRESEIGSSPDEWFERVHSHDVMQLRAAIHAHLERQTPHFENEHRLLHQDGSYRWMLTRGLAVFDANGEALRMAGSQTDITTRKEAEARLVHDALHDALTGLANRNLLLERLGWSIARLKRHPNNGFGVLFLDLDRFKVINDSLGHTVGDHLLVELARRLETCVRPGDTVARLGGDEFTILLDEVNGIVDAERVAQRIDVALATPFTIAGEEIYASASIGITLSSREYTQPEELLRDADAAMYRAKSLGRARHEVFEGELHGRALARLQMETALRHALEREELHVEYQPIVSLQDDTLMGFEALVRWRRPDGTSVSPAEFIPVAEDAGVIGQLGLWVLETATREAQSWQERSANPISVSVNVSPRQIADKDFVANVKAVLASTGFDPSLLLLEITENMLIEEPDAAVAVLRDLQAAKIRMCLDDFGTGYSSLNALQWYPIDVIKIDRSFVMRMGLHGERPEIPGAIVMLANSLGIRVTAEGVETAEQLELLRDMQCDCGQGYYFARSMPAAAVPHYIATGEAPAHVVEEELPGVLSQPTSG